MLNTPPELIGIPEEERQFWRLIEERKLNPDGTEDIVLACGHARTNLTHTHSWTYAYCAQCLHEWIEAQKHTKIHEPRSDADLLTK